MHYFIFAWIVVDNWNEKQKQLKRMNDRRELAGKN